MDTWPGGKPYTDRLPAEVERDDHGYRYLREWLVGKRALRPTTRRSYESHLRLYLQPSLGQVLLSDLRPHHLDAMYGDLLVGDHGKRSAATVRRVHATVRSALNTAVKRRLIPWNPALHVELPAAERIPTNVSGLANRWRTSSTPMSTIVCTRCGTYRAPAW